MTMRFLKSWSANAVVIFFGAITNIAQAQTPPAPLFQNATITGSGNTITATRVPVVLSTTLTVYVDVTLEFNADANGNLTIANGSPQIVQSPILLTGNFKPGTYLGPTNLFNGKGLISVSGPGIAGAGFTIWSLTTALGQDPGTYPTSANWWVGPIANNPYAARINAAHLTSTAYAYGIATTTPSNAPPAWQYSSTGTLIGVTQTGNVLSIASFSSYGGSDQNVPYSILTFTLQP